MFSPRSNPSADGVSAPVLDLFALLDERTGPIVSMIDIDVPDGFWASQSELCETAGFGLASGSPAAAGCSRTSGTAARIPALGEAVERYCGHLVDHRRLVWSSWKQFHETGIDAIDPRVLALYRKSQTENPRFPFSGLTTNDEVAWISATDFDGANVMVPAALVWLAPGPQSMGTDQRHITLPISAGIATGRANPNGQPRQPPPSTTPSSDRVPPVGVDRGHQRTDAVAHALCEVLERHALGQAWHSGATFVQLRGLIEHEHFATYYVANHWDLPVVLATYKNVGLLSFGCALSSSWQTAAEKACSEAALMARTTSLIETGELDWHRPEGPLAELRADKRYCLDYAADYSNVTDVTCHAQMLLDPVMQSLVEDRLGSLQDDKTVRELASMKVPKKRPSAPFEPGVGDAEANQANRFCETLIELLHSENLRPVVVDITSPDMAMCGLQVVRVIVPGLRSTGPAAFPFLGDGFEPLPTNPCLLPVPHV